MAVSRKHPLANCEECPLYETGKYVPPEINGSKYVFVGEAPGGNEAKKGKPFIGVSGKLLDAVLEGHGLSRKDATLTNTVLCRPIGNADPNPTAVKCCSTALHGVIADAEPTHVVALGKFAASALAGRQVKITQERVGPPKQLEGKPYKFIPTVHPAACLRNTNLFPMLDADIGKLKQTASIQWEPPKWKALDNATQARAAIGQLLQRELAETLVIDIEVGQDKDVDFGHPNTLLAVGLGYEPGKVLVLGRDALRSNAVRRDLATLLGAKAVVAHNAKYDLGTLHRMGLGTHKVHYDTMLAAYAMDEVPGTKGLKYLAKEHLGAPDWDKELKEAGGFDGAPLEVLYKYNAFDVGTTWDLMELQQSQMDDDARKLHRYLCWASDALMLIEDGGVLLDEPHLQVQDKEMRKELEGIKESITELVEFSKAWDNLDPKTVELMQKGGGFNPNSVPQVKGVLEAMTSATIATTDADMLTYLTKHKSPVVQEFAIKMLEWRSIGKMHGTYVAGWMRRMDEHSRVHPTYLIHGTETGRLSARNPNVQNPPRGEFRKAVIAAPGHKLMYADYSNIEGRVVATLAQSDSMAEVLRDPNQDIHGKVAEMFYGPDYTKEQRVVAKSVVHGANYARTPEGISEGLGCSLAEATKVYNAYHKLFPEVKPWHASVKHQVLSTDEPLTTPWGRKRRFGLITRDNMEDVYKEGLAFQPQSIGSDICLTAGVRLHQLGFAVRILIHDGILMEIPEDFVKDAERQVRMVMMDAAKEFTEYVPFPVDINTGDNWAEVD